MAALRKALSYSKMRARPYTRKSRVRQKAYIKAVPPVKIVKFDTGDAKGYRAGKYKFVVTLICEENIQMRDNAIESGRLAIAKVLETKALGQCYMSIKVHPHHILRENKTAAGAGADRLSSGMSHSFGVAIGRAALLKPGKEIYVIYCENDQIARVARDVLQSVKSKMPCRTRVVFGKTD